jgi:hypothetical protein
MREAVKPSEYLTVQEAEEVCRCPQCCNVLEEPVRLACGHAVCRECAVVLWLCEKRRLAILKKEKEKQKEKQKEREARRKALRAKQKRMREKMHLRAELEKGKREAEEKMQGLEKQHAEIWSQTDSAFFLHGTSERKKSLSNLSSWLAHAKKEVALHQTKLSQHDLEHERLDREDREKEEQV